MRIPSVKTFFCNSKVRISLAILACLWFVFASLFYVAYETAYAHLQLNDPTILQNRSELQVFYAPLKVSVGEKLSIEDLTEYFTELGYNLTEEETSGSFSFDKSVAKFFPSSENFKSGQIKFKKNRISKIITSEQDVEKIELEPLSMRNFVKYIKDKSLRPQLVRRIVLSPNAIPKNLTNGVKAAEDTRYSEHKGIDVFGIGYRLVTLRGGGSSITQQLIKNNVIKGSKEEFWQNALGFLPPKIQRKIMEIPFAIAAEEMLTKDQILAAYLSMIPLAASEGVEIHGVISASQEYFGKSVSELTLAESALMAGMIHKPSVYVGAARRGKYKKLKKRRNVILNLMRRNNQEKYPSKSIEKAKKEKIKFVFASAKRTERPADAYSRLFATYVANHLPEKLSEIRKTEGNLRIFTTLDYRLQKSATEISEKHLDKISKKVLAECIRQKGKGFDCKSVKPQVSMVAIDAETGDILAMYGGNSLEFNFATAKRSPASAIKPFYYLKALEEGIWNGKPFTTETIIDPENDSVSFRPKNNVGKISTAMQGLAKSYNFHAVAAAESVGLKNATEFVGKLTDSNPEINGVSAIGGSNGSETSLINLASAYTVFANKGVFVKATPNKFYVLDGEKVDFDNLKPKRLASVDSAVNTNEMLKQVLSKDGTASNFKGKAGLINSNEISGKTGSGMVADLWFFALTPKIVVGVWVGLPKNKVQLKMKRKFTGGQTASPIAAEFFKEVKSIKPNLLN